MNPHLPHLLHLRRVREVREVRVVFLFCYIYAHEGGCNKLKSDQSKRSSFTTRHDVFTTRLYFFTRGRDVFTRGRERCLNYRNSRTSELPPKNIMLYFGFLDFFL